MQIRSLAIAVAALSLGASALAEPAKPAPQQPAQPANRPAQVVLASAEESPTVPTPSAQETPAPAKKRAARVTTCRCAGQSSDH
jgi:hypothetical protein